MKELKAINDVHIGELYPFEDRTIIDVNFLSSQYNSMHSRIIEFINSENINDCSMCFEDSIYDPDELIKDNKDYPFSNLDFRIVRLISICK